MKSKSFVLSAIILALGGFFAKAIGALYKIPLTNILGSSGMGLYYLVFPVYSLIITICSSGISVALSTEVSKCRRLRHRYNEQKLLRVALIISFAISLLFTFVVILICRPLSVTQGNINAYLGYIAIAPAIIISSIIVTLRGYFQGVENMVPTTVSMIIEQIVKLSVGLILAHLLCRYGIQYAVLGAIIGVTLSEVVALIIISINFFTFKGQLYYNYRNMNYKEKKKVKVIPLLKSKMILSQTTIIQQKKSILKCSSVSVRFTTKKALYTLLKVAFPSMLSSIVLPIITMLDSFMIINLLIESGYSSYVSTSLYGLWGGVVQSLISLPIIIIAGVSTSIVPSLSGVVAGQDEEKIGRRVVFFIKITWILSVILFVLVFVFARDILYFLYGDGLADEVIDELSYATTMLQLSSLSIIYYAFLQTFTAILQSIGKAHLPFVSLIISSIIRIGLVVWLVREPSINIFGVLIANTLFLGITIIILAFVVKRSIDVKFHVWRHMFFPLVAGGVSLIIMKVGHMCLSEFINYFASMIICALVGMVVYVIWTNYSGFFSNKEKKNFSLGKNRLIKGEKIKKFSHSDNDVP